MNASKSSVKKERKEVPQPPKRVWHGSKLSPAVVGSLFGRLEDVATRLDDFLADLEGYLPELPEVEDHGSEASSGEEVIS